MHSSERKPQRSSRLAGCLIALAIPVVIIAALLAVLIVNNRPAAVLIPTPKMPVPNGYDDFINATKLIGSIKSPVSDTSRPVNAWTIPQYEAFVKDNAQAIALVRLGLRKDYLAPPVRDMLTYNYADNAGVRELARIMVGESLYYHKIGQYGKAADSCLDVMEMGVMLPHGGPLLSQLVGGAVESIGSYYLPDTLSELSAEELAHVAFRLEKIQAGRVEFGDVVMEEGYTSIATAQSLVRKMNPSGGLGLLSFIPPPSASASKSSSPTRLWNVIRYGFSNKSRGFERSLAFYKTLAKDQNGYYTGKVNVIAPSDPMCTIIIDSSMINTSHIYYCRAQAITTMLETEVALCRYRFDHDSYPASLRVLTPKYLKKTPVDPFGQGKPLCYKPLKNGQDFLLYSRGRNLKDDGGRDAPWNKKEGKDLVAVKQTK